jgi:hypothetical protein
MASPRMSLLDEPLLGLSSAYQEIVVNGKGRPSAIRKASRIIITVAVCAAPSCPLSIMDIILGERLQCADGDLERKLMG